MRGDTQASAHGYAVDNSDIRLGILGDIPVERVLAFEELVYLCPLFGENAVARSAYVATCAESFGAIGIYEHLLDLVVVTPLGKSLTNNVKHLRIQTIERARAI